MKFYYPTSARFRCIKCGICCGDTKQKTRHVLLLKTEVEQIAEATSQQITQFAVQINGTEPYGYEMKKNAENGKCVFLENNRCKIYTLRPLICRFYPFELDSCSGKNSFGFTEECPGIGRGRILREEHFKKMFRLASIRHRRTADSSGVG